HLRVRQGRPQSGWQCHRTLPRHRRAAEVRGAYEGGRHSPRAEHVRRRDGGAVMVAALFVFVVVTGLVLGAAWMAMNLPTWLAARKMAGRLKEVSRSVDMPDTPSFVAEGPKSPLPSIDKVLAKSGSGLAKLI